MTSLGCHQEGTRLKPTSPLDYVVVAVVGVGCIPFVAANVVLLCNWGYPPIRQKNVDLTVASSIGGLIWLLTTVVLNHHFKNSEFGGPHFCPIWSLWLRGVLGFALWLNCLNSHLFALQQILVKKQKSSQHRLLPLLLMQLPIIIFCIAGTSVGASHRNTSGDCQLVTAWADVYALLPLLYFFLFLVLAFRLRAVRAQYNEFGIIRKGGVIALFFYLLSVVYLATDGDKEVIGRCFLTFSVATAVFYYFWARNAKVVRAVLFRKDAFLEQWREAFASNESLKEELQDLSCSANAFKERVKELEEEIATLHSQQSSITVELQEE